MSHVVEIKTEIRDEAAVKAACVRLQIPTPEHKTVRLFNATTTGLLTAVGERVAWLRSRSDRDG